MTPQQKYSRTDKGRKTEAERKDRTRDKRAERQRERSKTEAGRKAAKISRERSNAIVRAFIRDSKDRPCTDCGNLFDTVCMDFDHRPGEIKHFRLASPNGRSLSRVKAEIAKCDLVCANCHRLRTHRQRDHRSICKLGRPRPVREDRQTLLPQFAQEGSWP